MEIEHWDHENKKAWLWVKIPYLDPDEDTDLYLYYDSTHPDNDAWVGDPGDAVVHNVWDNHFRLVSHMQDDPDTSHVRDSTVNANEGTKGAANEPLEVDGITGKAQQYDGLDDYIHVVDDPSLRITDKITVLARFKPDHTDQNVYVLSKTRYRMKISGNQLQALVYFGAVLKWVRSTAVVGTDWIEGCYTYDKDDGTNKIKLYINGAEVTYTQQDDTGGFPIDDSTGNELFIGSFGYGYIFHGLYDESIVASTARSSAWIKASYESWIDHPNDFGDKERFSFSACYIPQQAIKILIE